MSDAKATCTPEYLASPQSVLFPNGMPNVSQSLYALITKGLEGCSTGFVEYEGCCHCDNVFQLSHPALQNIMV